MRLRSGRHLARCREDRLHQRAAVIDELLQALAVSLQIVDRPSGHAGFHRGPGNRRRDLDDQARIERLGDDVIRTEGQFLDAAVGRGDDIALLLPRKLGDCMHRRDFHRPGDGRGADIQRAAKNERKAQDVVDLIRVVAAARRDDGVVRARALTSSGRISGVGLASASIKGRAAIRRTMSCVSTPPAESPRNTSAPPMISSRLRASVGCANRAFSGSINSCRPA